jgi:hypothetical protein
MEIQQSDNGLKGSFYIEKEGIRTAEMTYVWAGTDRIIIDHTDVGPALKGKNAGKQMIFKAVDFAREKRISIIPLCPFAKSVFARMPEIRDVL